MSQLDLSPREFEILRLLIADYERKISADDDIEPEALSEREHEILLLLASGHDGAQIAVRCSIALSTVKSHIASIFAKLNARNARHAVAIALRLNLVGVADISLP